MTAFSETPITILLVEDNPADADLVIEALEEPGPAFATVHVERLSAAVQYVTDRAPDAVLLDLSLPDSQGLATFRRLHARAPHVPIVVLSGLVDEELAAQAVREGAQDYLVKGEADQRLLTRALRYAIERQRAEAERLRLVEREHAARARAEVAERTLQARDQFLSIAVHELKTPLTVLFTSVQLLVRLVGTGAPLDPSALDERLRTMERQARKLTRLVEHLLDISRLERGTLEIEVEEADIATLVEEAAGIAQSRTVLHRIRVYASGRPHIPVDRLRVEQVLTNLLDNAIKFSPDGGDIEVEVLTLADGGARVAVRDHGIGIPAEHRSRIFEPYYQAHADDHRSGLGLGLHISRRIVEQHGGSIRAEFPADGGTRIVIELPVGSVPAIVDA